MQQQWKVKTVKKACQDVPGWQKLFHLDKVLVTKIAAYT